eukprot:12355297-Alexandrium_andersonii.AAC.1
MHRLLVVSCTTGTASPLGPPGSPSGRPPPRFPIRASGVPDALIGFSREAVARWRGVLEPG